MIKVEVLREFTLKKFNELKNLKRADERKNEKGKLYDKDTFECNKEMVDYLTGNNPYKSEFIKVIEIIPEEETKKERAIVAGDPQEKKAQNTRKRK